MKIKYKEHYIKCNRFMGWYSVFIADKGYLKADTIKGVKELINNNVLQVSEIN